MAAVLCGILTARAAEPLRVFIRAGVKTHGPNQHDHPRFLADWTKLLGERGLKVEGAMKFPDSAALENTDLMVIYAADGMKIEGDQRVEFEKFLRRGGGLVVIHDGIVCGEEHEWCKTIIGARWRWASASVPRNQAARWLEGNVGLTWTDTKHPISRDMPKFNWKDEIYYELDPAPDIEVLAVSSDNSRNVMAPQIWTCERTLIGGTTAYRAFISLPGHEYDSFNTPQYRTVLLRGIAWAGKRANVDEFCKPEELESLRNPVTRPTSPPAPGSAGQDQKAASGR
jgi:type 1 glutamine amidotransferase